MEELKNFSDEQLAMLLKDLCARLPYSVKVAFFNEDLTHHSEPKTLIRIECVNNLNYSKLEDEDGNTTIVEFVKPYLFPLSSMTEEQKEEYCQLQARVIYNSKGPVNTDVINYINWCYKNHIDMNNLIPMGLALDATGLNIY